MLRRICWLLPYEMRHFAFKVVHPTLYRTLQRLRTVEPETRRGKSLKPFVDHKCIFVHIPKCAGISVAYTLFGHRGGAHYSIEKYQKIFTKTEFEEFFKFTIVRNPWDRLVSAYHYFLQGGRNEKDRRWAEKHLSKYETFNDFVKEWISRDRVFKSLVFRPQYSFVCLPGSLTPTVDFIGRFENLDADFSYIKKKLAISAPDLPSLNKSKARKNDYRKYYNGETRQIIADVYREDIELFDYNFDNVS